MQYTEPHTVHKIHILAEYNKYKSRGVGGCGTSKLGNENEQFDVVSQVEKFYILQQQSIQLNYYGTMREYLRAPYRTTLSPTSLLSNVPASQRCSWQRYQPQL
jgi:hypothetical protein